MTNEEIEKIRARAEASTLITASLPGDAHWVALMGGLPLSVPMLGTVEQDRANIDFLVNARKDVLSLLDQLAPGVEAEVEQLRERAKRFEASEAGLLSLVRRAEAAEARVCELEVEVEKLFDVDVAADEARAKRRLYFKERNDEARWLITNLISRLIGHGDQFDAEILKRADRYFAPSGPGRSGTSPGGKLAP